MTTKQWEIVILKPTPIFLKFLAAHIPDMPLPDWDILQADTTAYVIEKRASDEETLDEIEKNFVKMFQHEVSRWLSVEVQHGIKCSFLDFLCCFKFEFHSQIVLMEPSLEEGAQLISVKPRSVLLKWVKSVPMEQHDYVDVIEKVNLSHLSENATVVVKNFKNLLEVMPFVKHYYQPIYKAELMRMCDNQQQWPEIESYDVFSRYFNIELHTHLVHLH